jgi:hypothetical protein
MCQAFVFSIVSLHTPHYTPPPPPQSNPRAPAFTFRFWEITGRGHERHKGKKKEEGGRQDRRNFTAKAKKAKKKKGIKRLFLLSLSFCAFFAFAVVLFFQKYLRSE